MPECPICAAEVAVGHDVIAGEILICDDCGSELEILETEPVELAQAPTAEEDWDQ